MKILVVRNHRSAPGLRTVAATITKVDSPGRAALNPARFVYKTRAAPDVSVCKFPVDAPPARALEMIIRPPFRLLPQRRPLMRYRYRLTAGGRCTRSAQHLQLTAFSMFNFSTERISRFKRRRLSGAGQTASRRCATVFRPTWCSGNRPQAARR